MTFGEEASLLDMERSTLRRNLDVPLHNSSIEEVDDPEYLRSKQMKIAPAGENLLQPGMPAWEAAQASASALFGADDVDLLRNLEWR